MPGGAYILLKASLIMSCFMLLGSFYMFLRYFEQPELGRGVYLTAVTLLENPAGVLMAGLMGMAFLIDRRR